MIINEQQKKDSASFSSRLSPKNGLGSNTRVLLSRNNDSPRKDAYQAAYTAQQPFQRSALYHDAIASHPRVSIIDKTQRGSIDAFSNTCRRWRLNTDDQLVLLGFKKNADFGSYILTGQIKPQSQDVDDRIGYIVGISLGLGVLFNESLDAENGWLRLPRSEYRGKSALEHMLQGHMTNLISVSEALIRERGL